MLLNRIEYALVNNPLRALLQRRFEARRLLRIGGALSGGVALELGCGRGVGVNLILDDFGAARVDAFDLDPRMVAQARKRLHAHAEQVRLWVGDAAQIPVPDATYDAVFDFAIIHHVPGWRRAVAEVHRVLKPGGRFYAEEVLEKFTTHPIVRRLLDHPEDGRFDSATFAQALREVGLRPLASETLWQSFAWFVAVKP